ncbi:hypothetical protein FA13DRAFT_1736823 [Coprinellus micaceus]|uniref:Galactose oxidase n=1 Tax=Coprinellus micaceus TaxID=71717 RepID=A0A4Y7SZH6_COPMI|nr:hypothetical protein FA13DRAFT_1736823 [Coprinellus micaceus]
MHLPWTWFILLNALALQSYAADVLSRWGQAVVVVNDILYVYGGKTDEFNEFSYTSAPTTNDLLTLSLASAFSTSSTPWTVISGNSNSSSPQGPALAWHTASAYNSSQILVFGGIPDVNSDIVLLRNPDSAVILDIWDRLNAVWIVQQDSWANQPTRRIRHSTVTIPSGLIFIFGGERADGSGIACSDNWVFDPKGPSFTELPTENGPPDLVGHVSIILPDGRILVLGGYVPLQRVLLLFSTIYVLDTTKTPYTWSRLLVSSGSLPNARRAFAATLITPDRILIHGGSDAQLQTTLDDGWILDLSPPEATWTRLDSLSGIGARRDHFAVSSGDNVVFGFGYSQSAPAPDPVQVYNIPNSTIVPTFTPRPSTSTPAYTLPPATRTPTTTPNTHQASPTPTPAPGPQDPDTPAEAEAKKNRTTTIAVSLAAIIVGIWYYRRRQQRKWEQARFWVIDGDDSGTPGVVTAFDDDDDDSQIHRDIPLAGASDAEAAERGQGSRAQGWLGALGIAGLGGLLGASTVKSQNPREKQERRNMLDDEDNADFGTWYNNTRREGTGGSSWSVMSILGRKNKRLTTDSATSTPWREKGDPFADDASSLMRADDESVNQTRPRTRREMSHVSARSGVSYSDPFSDPIEEEPRGPSETAYRDEPSTSSSVRVVPPVSAGIRTSLLPLDFTAHSLSPLSERTSQSTLAGNASGSSLARLSTNDSTLGAPASQASSRTSQQQAVAGGSEPLQLSPTLFSGLLPAVDGGTVNRSNSWWSRIARRASDASSRSTHHPARELRDPNPPPRLSMIAEKTTPESESPGSRKSSQGTTGKPGSTGSGVGRKASLYPGGAKHGKSMSSVQTVDSEALDRIAGLSSETTHEGSVMSSREISYDEQFRHSRGPTPLLDEIVSSPLEINHDPIDSQLYQVERGGSGPIVATTSLRAPAPVRPLGPRASSAASLLLSKSSTPSTPTSADHLSALDGLPRSGSAGSLGSGRSGPRSGSRSPLPDPPRSASQVERPRSGSVAARVKLLEGESPRRATVIGSRPNLAGSSYGLVPRRSLFIVNPDNKRTSMGSAESANE